MCNMFMAKSLVCLHQNLLTNGENRENMTMFQYESMRDLIFCKINDQTSNHNNKQISEIGGENVIKRSEDGMAYI